MAILKTLLNDLSNTLREWWSRQKIGDHLSLNIMKLAYHKKMHCTERNILNHTAVASLSKIGSNRISPDLQIGQK